MTKPTGRPNGRPRNPPTSGEARQAALRNIAIQKELLRRHYRMNLYDFARDVLEYDRLIERVHRPLCERLQRIYWGQESGHDFEGVLRRFMNLMARGGFKTTIGTVSFTTWILVQNDPPDFVRDMVESVDPWQPPRSFNGKPGYDQRIMLVQETQQNSMKYLKAIKAHFTDNSTLRDLFGDLVPDRKTRHGKNKKWAAAETDIAWRQNMADKDPNLSASGLDVATMGGHFDIILNDDLHPDDENPTLENLQRAREMYSKEITLADPFGAIIILTGVRTDDGDLPGYVLREESDLWDVIVQPARWTDESGNYVYLMPEIMDQKFLDERERTIGKMRLASQYMLDPIGSDAQKFRPEYFTEDVFFQNVAPDQLKAFLKNKIGFITVDLADADDGSACFDSIVAAAWEGGRGWFHDLFRKQGTQPSEIIEILFDWWVRYKPLAIGVEKVLMHKYFKAFADQKSMETGIYPNFVDLQHGGRSKTARIMGLEPYASSKSLRFSQKCREITEELMRVPRGRFKDAADAAAYQLDLVLPLRAMVDTVEEPRGWVPDPEMPKAYEEASDYMEAFYAEEW